jgi:hypothetical protein
MHRAAIVDLIVIVFVRLLKAPTEHGNGAAERRTHNRLYHRAIATECSAR